MLRLFCLMIILAASPSLAAQYGCNSSLSNAPSLLWNASYWINVRPTFNGNATARVRLVRNLGSAIPRGELIDMQCQPGSLGSEYDCVERPLRVSRPELLAAQFFPNGWGHLYATPTQVWQPVFLGQIYCQRRF